MAKALPFNLSVLLAVPVTKEAFLAATSAEPPSDYLVGMLGDRSPNEVWSSDDGYWRVAAAALEFADHARELGGRITTEARLSDLRQATETSDVVILCGHWRGEGIAQKDVVGSPDQIIAALRASPEPLGGVLRSALSSLIERLPTGDERRIWRNQLVSRLNELILMRGLCDALGVTDPHERSAIGAALSRAAIDEILGPCVSPGNRLELGDGLVGEGEVEEAVAAGFAGELDLSACQSVYLARYMSACRAHQIPRPIFHHGINLLLPITRFRTLVDTLSVCADHQMRYFDARALVENSMIQAFKEKSGPKHGRRKLWDCLHF